MSSQRQAIRQSVRRALAATIAGVVVAAPLQAAVFEEFVVTAQKREQDIQDVGISVSAFTGDQMRVLGVQDSFDIAMFIPNVNISGNLAGQNTQFSIRGVTQNDFNDIIEAPVAVYLDEGYIPIAQGQTFAVYDIERVEVLKGPQSTLFGRNATGGVVQYLSRKPNMDEMEGYVDATLGQYDTGADPNYSKIEGAFSIPFTDSFAGRIAGMYDQRDGYLENVYIGDDANRFGAGTVSGGGNGFAANAPGSDAGADLGESETTALRGILQWDTTENLRFTLMGNYAKSDMATGPYQSKPTAAVYSGDAPSSTGFYPNSAGEIVNVVDQPSDSSNRSFCSDGSDCGSDQDNDGVLDNFFGQPAGSIDTTRVNNQFAPTNGGDFFGYKDPDGEDWTFSGDFAFADSGSSETTGAQLRVEWDLGSSSTLTSISDFKNFEKLMFIDVDSAPVNQSANYAGVDADSFSQELRIDGSTDRMNWVAGFYYLFIDSTSQNGLKFPGNSVVNANGGGALGGTPFDLGSDAQLETNSYSLFGQMDYEIVDRVTLIGGVRVIQEEKDYWFQQGIYVSQDARTVHDGTPIVIGPTYPGGVPTAFTDSPSETLWAGKLQVDYRPNDNWLLYAGINRGVKAGSFNAQLAGGLPTPVSAIPYDSETLHSFETGFKSTWGGGNTRFNGTFFYYDYSDYQAFLFSGVSGIVINQDAETYGFEFEVLSSPTDGLDLLLSAGWFDSTVKDVPLRAEIPSDGGAPCTSASPVICRDVKPVYAPEIQVAGLARYEWSLGQGMMNIQGDFTWSDEAYYNLRNFDADKFSSYTLVNAILGWTSPEEAWNVTLAGRNLTDEFAGIQGFDLATLCGCNEISFRQPRRYEVAVKFSF